jgi:farnesyl-diphosphate farnesyltransferase
VATAVHRETTESAAQFCWRALDGVSRSFAAVIRQLPPGPADAVMVSYLLCRIADSIEDSNLPTTDKQAHLRRLPAQIEEPTAGKAQPPEFVLNSVPQVYRELLSRPEAVFEIYRALPGDARAAILACVQEMSDGMALWTARSIETIADQNDYCYYVAGVVGKLLTELFRVYGMVSAQLAAELMKHAVQFGLALQKVNILRDVRADWHDGRFYWPQALLRNHGIAAPQQLFEPVHAKAALGALNDLVADVLPYFADALQYTTLLPRNSRLRSFCAIPLFMATATARVCRDNPNVLLQDEPVKIARSEAKKIVLQSKMFGWSNAYLRRWYRRDLALLTTGH